eukprot:15452710-Alexandrium_andersonii.AAC.1
MAEAAVAEAAAAAAAATVAAPAFFVRGTGCGSNAPSLFTLELPQLGAASRLAERSWILAVLSAHQAQRDSPSTCLEKPSSSMACSGVGRMLEDLSLIHI